MAATPNGLLPDADTVCDQLRRLMAGMSAEEKAAFLLAGARLAAARADELCSGGRHGTDAVGGERGLS